HTRAGLRWRATGEHPLAAETAGANVARVRMAAVTAWGAAAAAGGGYLSLGRPGRFGGSMGAGAGFHPPPRAKPRRREPAGGACGGAVLRAGAGIAAGARRARHGAAVPVPPRAAVRGDDRRASASLWPGASPGAPGGALSPGVMRRRARFRWVWKHVWVWEI